MYAEIIPSLRLPKKFKSFDYILPDELKDGVRAGSIVFIPFGKKIIPGVVLKIKNKTAIKNLKPIKNIVGGFGLPTDLLKTVFWMEKNLDISLPLALKTILPNIPKKNNAPRKTEQVLKTEPPKQNSFSCVRWQKIKEKNLFVIKLIKEALKENKSILLLEPRLQNAHYMRGVLEKKIQEPILIYHSKLKKTEIWSIWKNTAEGRAKIIISTRHGVFLPIKNPGLIIFDDEEDIDFQSIDQKPYYDSRVIAISRSKWNNFEVVALSQSPSVRSYFYSTQKKSFRELNDKKHIPQSTIVDIRSGNYSPLSYALEKAIQNTLQKGKKVVLFLNRKGKASLVTCRDCSFVWKCDECELPLRAYEKTLRCNHCRIKKSIPLICNKCKGVNIHFVGTGTQKIEKELKTMFPTKKISRIDKDSDQESKKIHESEIIIGTEFFYKNYLYPHNKIKNIGLVVVPIVDTLFNLPDFQTDEKALAWIIKFINFAEQETAEIIIQTYSPENHVLRLACKNSLDFYRKEIGERKKFGYPPFNTKK